MVVPADCCDEMLAVAGGKVPMMEVGSWSAVGGRWGSGGSGNGGVLEGCAVPSSNVPPSSFLNSSQVVPEGNTTKEEEEGMTAPSFHQEALMMVLEMINSLYRFPVCYPEQDECSSRMQFFFDCTERLRVFFEGEEARQRQLEAETSNVLQDAVERIAELEDANEALFSRLVEIEEELRQSSGVPYESGFSLHSYSGKDDKGRNGISENEGEKATGGGESARMEDSERPLRSSALQYGEGEGERCRESVEPSPAPATPPPPFLHLEKAVQTIEHREELLYDVKENVEHKNEDKEDADVHRECRGAIQRLEEELTCTQFQEAQKEEEMTKMVEGAIERIHELEEALQRVIDEKELAEAELARAAVVWNDFLMQHPKDSSPPSPLSFASPSGEGARNEGLFNEGDEQAAIKSGTSEESQSTPKRSPHQFLGRRDSGIKNDEETGRNSSLPSVSHLSPGINMTEDEGRSASAASSPSHSCAACARLIKELEESHALLQQKEDNLQKQLEITRSLQESHDELSTLITEGATHLKEQMKSLYEEKVEAERRSERLQQQLEREQKELETVHHEAEKWKREVEALRHALQSAEVEVSHNREVLQQSIQQGERQKVYAAEREQRHKLEMERFHNENMAHLQRVQAMHTEETASLREELRALSAELEDCQTKAELLAQENRIADAQVDALRTQCGELQASSAALRREYQEAILTTNWSGGVSTTSQAMLPRRSSASLSIQQEDGNEEYPRGMSAELPPSPPKVAPASSLPSAVDHNVQLSVDARLSSLLARNGALEDQLQSITAERDRQQHEVSVLQRQVLSSQRVVEIREQALQRLTEDITQVRASLARSQEDVVQRVQTIQSLNTTLEHTEETCAALHAEVERYEQEAQQRHQEIALLRGCLSMMEEKWILIPTLIEFTALFPLRKAHMDVVCLLESDRKVLHGRCDKLEKDALQVLKEVQMERQVFQETLQGAVEKNQSLEAIIQKLQMDALGNEQALLFAAQEAEQTRKTMEEALREAMEGEESAEVKLASAKTESSSYRQALERLRKEKRDQEEEVERTLREQQEAGERREDLIRQLREQVKQHELAREKERETYTTELWELRESNVSFRSDAEEFQRLATGLQRQLDQLLPRLSVLEEERGQRTAELLQASHQLANLSHLTEKEEKERQNQVLQMKRTIEELTGEVATLHQAEISLTEERDRLTAELQVAQREVNKLTSRCTVLDREQRTLLSQNMTSQRRFDEELVEVNASRQEAEQRARSLQSQVEVLEVDRSTIREEMIAAQKSRDALELRCQQLEHHRAQLEAQLQRRLEDLTSKQEALASKEESHIKERRLLMEQRDQYKKEVEVQEEAVRRLEQQLSSSNRQHEMITRALQSAQAAHQAEMLNQRQSQNAAEDALAQLRVEHTKLQGKLQQEEYELQQRELEISRHQEQIRILKEQWTDAQRSREKEKSEAQEQLEKTTQECHTHSAEVRRLTAALQALEHSYSQSADRSRVLEADAAVYEEQRKAQQSEVDELKLTALRQREQHRRDRQEFLHQIEVLEERLTEASREEETAKSSLQRLQQRWQVEDIAFQKEIQKLKEEVSAKDRALTTLQRQHEQLQEAAARYQRVGEGAKETVQQLRVELENEKEALRLADTNYEHLQHQMEALKREQEHEVSRLQREQAAELEDLQRKMDEALQKAQQKVEEARIARDALLERLGKRTEDDERQRVLYQQFQEEKKKDLQQYNELMEYVLEVRQMAADAALQIGVVPATVPTTLSSSSTAPLSDASQAKDGEEAKEAATEVDVCEVIQILLRDWHHFMESAGTFQEEQAELEGLRGALERQQEASKELARQLAPLLSAPLGEEERPLELDQEVYEQAKQSLSVRHPRGFSRSTTPLLHSSLSGLPQRRGVPPSSPQQPPQQIQQQLQHHFHCIEQTSTTFGQRSQDHIRTIEQRLRQLALAEAMSTPCKRSSSLKGPEETTEVMDGNKTGKGSTSPPMWAAQAGLVLQRTQLSATISLLHQHASLAWRAITQLLEIVLSSTGKAGTAVGFSRRLGKSSDDDFHSRVLSFSIPGSTFTSSGLFDESVVVAFQSCRAILEEAEKAVVFPFHSLLSGRANIIGTAAGSAAGIATGGVPPTAISTSSLRSTPLFQKKSPVSFGGSKGPLDGAAPISSSFSIGDDSGTRLGAGFVHRSGVGSRLGRVA